MTKMLFIAACATLAAGCASPESGYDTRPRDEASHESRFEASPYGSALRDMMTACTTMQHNGELPGIEAGESESLRFATEGIPFSDKDHVRYPLKIDCLIADDNGETAFTFRKEHADGEWLLVK